MEFNPLLSGYSEMWDENRQWREARNRLAHLCRVANIHVNYMIPPGAEDAQTIKNNDTDELKNLTKIFAKNMNADTARWQTRYWQWATTYPGARSLRPDFFPEKDPATGWGVGYPYEPTYKQYDSRTMQWYELPGPWLPLPAQPAYPGEGGLSGVSEDIQAKIDKHEAEATYLRAALNDWLWWHGINAFVMDEAELTSAIEYVNEAERGNPIMQMMIESAAPQVPDYQGSYEPPTAPPPVPFFSLQNFDLARTWPGIAAGAALAIFL